VGPGTGSGAPPASLGGALRVPRSTRLGRKGESGSFCCLLGRLGSVLWPSSVEPETISSEMSFCAVRLIYTIKTLAG
jgi:hypothetical protein